MWTWSTVFPLKVSDNRAVADVPHWLVVSHLPDSQLAMIRKGAWTAIGINTLILLALFALLCAWLARALSGRARAQMEVTRAQAEAAAATRLSEVHQRFRLVVEANATGLLVVDSGGRIVLTNPALERMFGYAREELVGQPMETLLPESERGRHSALRTDYMSAPVPRPMGAGRDLHGRRKDGSILPVEISLSSFTENGQQYVDAVVVDISERKRIEQLHRYSETRLQLLMQTNPNGLLVVDDQGRIQMTNPALDRMFGYAPGELLDQAVESLVPEANRLNHGHLREQYLAAPGIRPMGAGLELHGRRKDGSTFPIAVSLASFEEAGSVLVQATIVDISARALA
jgi:protein-histidine pros-kinase